MLARNASPTHPSSRSPSTPRPHLSLPLVLIHRQRRVGCLSAPQTQPAAVTTDAPIAFSPAFFRKERAMLSYSDIIGRPETRVGRWHAMRNWRNEREKVNQGGEFAGLADEEDMD